MTAVKIPGQAGNDSSSAILLHVKQETFEVFAFRVVDVYGMVTWLVETVEDADAAATLGGCREYCKCECFLVYYL